MLTFRSGGMQRWYPDCIVFIRRPRFVSCFLFVPVIPAFSLFPDDFSLFHCRSQRSARNVDSRSLFNYKFCIGVNANVQGIVRLCTKNRRDFPSTSSLRDVFFCFAVAKSHSSFGFTMFLRNLFLPLVARNPPTMCMFVKQKNPPLRDYSSEARGIISRIKAVRFGAVSSDTAGNGILKTELHLILLR